MVEKALAKHVLGPTLNNNNNNNNKSWKKQTNKQANRQYMCTCTCCVDLSIQRLLANLDIFLWVVTSVIPLLWMWALFVMTWSGWKHFTFLKVYLMWFWLSFWLVWKTKLTLSICRRTKCRNGKLNKNDFSFFTGNTHSLVIRLRFRYNSNLFPIEMFQDGKAT